MCCNCCKGCNCIDRWFLIPRGLLKILELVMNVGAIVLVVTGRRDVSLRFIIKHWIPWGDINSGYFYSLNYCLATACIWTVITFLLFIIFLFKMWEVCGGFGPWISIDCTSSILALVMYIVAFILLCIYCGHWPTHHTIWNERLIAAAVFAVLAAILYLADAIVAITTGDPKRGKGRH